MAHGYKIPYSKQIYLIKKNGLRYRLDNTSKDNLLQTI